MLFSHVRHVAIMPIRTTMINRSALRSPNVTGFLKLEMNLWNSVRSFKLGTSLQKKISSRFVRIVKDKITSLKERAMQLSQGTMCRIGRGGDVMGFSVLGLAALCVYGLGLAAKVQLPGTIEYAAAWPQYVRQRFQDTYMYFGGTFALTALSAAGAFRNPMLMNMMIKNSYLCGAAMFGVLGTGLFVWNIPYTPGLGAKQLGWLVHCGLLGVVVAPMCMLGGPILLRSAMMTAGIVGGLSAIAVCAPSEKFLNMAGPLAVCLGLMFASSFAKMFVPATTALGYRRSIFLYGGLIFFSGFLLFTQRIVIKYAEVVPPNGVVPYDPVKVSMSIYLTPLALLAPILLILGGVILIPGL